MEVKKESFKEEEKKRNTLQDPTIEHNVYVTLEDIAKGVEKEIKLVRCVLQPDGSARKEEKVLMIKVKPGCKAGSVCIFPNMGDQHSGRIPADVVYTLRDQPHPLFKREGSDLRFIKKITREESLSGLIVYVPMLTGYKVQIDLRNETVKPTTEKRLLGHGLPLSKDPSRRGDMLISFNIEDHCLVRKMLSAAFRRVWDNVFAYYE